jgi:hypothetical protein
VLGEGDDGEAKYWLQPVALADAMGYCARELRVSARIVEAHCVDFVRAWHEFFGD